MSGIIADSVDLAEFTNDELSNDEFQSEGDNGQEHEEVFSQTHKFIWLCWERLQGLFKFCFVCSNNAVIITVVTKGGMVKVTIQCNDRVAIWNSEETIQGGADGNMVLCAGTILSDLTHRVISVTMETGGVKSMYYSIQENLFPAINHICKEHKALILDK